MIGFVSQPPFWVASLDPVSSTERPCSARYRSTIYPSWGPQWDLVHIVGPSGISDYDRNVPTHSTFHVSNDITHTIWTFCLVILGCNTLHEWGPSLRRVVSHLQGLRWQNLTAYALLHYLDRRYRNVMAWLTSASTFTCLLLFMQWLKKGRASLTNGLGRFWFWFIVCIYIIFRK